MHNHKHRLLCSAKFCSLYIRQLTAAISDVLEQIKFNIFFNSASDFGCVNCLICIGCVSPIISEQERTVHMKKKTFVSLLLMAVICLSCIMPALAAENTTTRGAVAFSSGMPRVAGTSNRYNPYAIASAGLPEQITVGFTLYKIVNGEQIYVTSATDSGYGNYFEAEALVTLSSGTYKLYAHYQGETTSDTKVTTYNIQ